jgi:hypothetical protein
MGKIFDIYLEPVSAGLYKAHVTLTNGMEFIQVISDMHLIDAWRSGDENPVIDYILARL